MNTNANGTFSNLVAGTGDVVGEGCMWANPDPTGEIGTADCPRVVTPPGAQSNLQNFFQLTNCGSTGNTRFAFGIDFVGTVGQLGGGACGPEDAAGTTSLSSVSTNSYNILGAVQISGSPTITNPPVVNSFLVTGAFVAETA